MSSIPPTEREFHHPPECETSLRPDVPGSKASPQCAQNILIAVMGDTGVGKSYFIRDVSGLSTVVVGDSPGSCTSEVIEYAFEYAGITVTLIDTPGFNDTKLSDTEVLTRITSWTQKRYSDHQLLSGIIYLHRITDVRMEGPSLKNLHMFEKLVGEGCLHNVLLTTTRWSELSKERGQAREMELKLTPEYWGNMIESGATVARYMGCRESGLKLIDKLIGNMPKALTIQEELAIPGTKLIDTGTGMAINKELLEIQAKLSKDLDETKEAHKRAMEKQRDSLKRMLEGEQQKMQERLDKIVKDREELLTRHNAREEQTASVLSTIEQKLEAERRERVEEQRRLMEHAEIRERTAEVERVKLRALMEAERKAREEAERRAREETEQRAREEAARRVKEEAERRAKEEAARRAKEEAERAKLMAMMEAERKRREEAGGNKLCDASRNNNEVLVRQLLENGIGVDWRNKGGDTALIIASFYSHEAIVRLLLAKGADVNMKNKYGNTALHDASFKGTEVIVRLLLEHGANIDEADGQGPALHIVLRGNRQSIVQLLLKNGANVHTRSLNNETALHSACRGGCDEAIVRFLLEKGVDVHAKCKYGMTALMFASFNGHAAIVRFLLEKGVDVNMQAINAFGTTALIEASKFGRLEVVQLLLENGADVKLKDYKGNTALSFANGYPAVVQLLRKAGAT